MLVPQYHVYVPDSLTTGCLPWLYMQWCISIQYTRTACCIQSGIIQAYVDDMLFVDFLSRVRASHHISGCRVTCLAVKSSLVD